MTNSRILELFRPCYRRAITLGYVFLLLAGYLSAQTAVVLAPVPKLQFLDSAGRPLAFGCVFTYQVASTTPLDTFTDYTGTTKNTNPVILSGGGSANIWLSAGLAYTFRVASAGGTKCASGSTLYTVDGIGGGATVLTTIVPYSPTPSFQDAAQIQLFTLTLTGNATAQPMTFVGVTPPGIIYFQITQDGSGGHTFSWPANTIGGCTIGSGINQVTTQAFVYNGTNATATGPCVTGNGPAITAGSIIDTGLSATSPVCTDGNKQLVSASCNSVLGITVNGQVIPPGGSGNVNAGAAAHSLALNQGNGNAITGLTLTNDQAAIGSTGADPVATSLPNCPNGNLAYNTSTHAFTCAPTVQSAVIQAIAGDTTIGSGADGTWVTKSVTMPSTGCPCRAFISYSAFYTSTNSGSFIAWVSDGTNNVATSQQNQAGSNASGSGLSASSYSSGTYANSASITFSGKAHPVSAGGMTVTANANSGPQTSWINIVIFTSN